VFEAKTQGNVVIRCQGSHGIHRIQYRLVILGGERFHQVGRHDQSIEVHT
jgi:hypothetical protein